MVDIDGTVRRLDGALAIHRAALHAYICVAAGLIGVPLTALVLALLGVYEVPASARTPLLLAGGLVSAGSSVPWQQIFSKRLTIQGLIYLREDCEEARKAGEPQNDAQREAYEHARQLLFNMAGN